ncbi:MAG: NADH-quinone oxidoreductase subunit M [Nitrosopumilaceae archaeon]|nr:NADH-quinone oxidoreductase subunit M [Nitrosopumilaceae archaeon]
MEYLALQVVFLPLLLSPLAYLLGRKFGPTTTMWFTFGILAYCTSIIIHQFTIGDYEEHYKWTEQFGEFGFLFDGLSSIFAIIIYLLCTILTLYSKPYMIHKFQENFKLENKNEQQSQLQNKQTMIVQTDQTEYINKNSGVYFALYLVFAMGMLGTVLATNLIEFYVFFEVMLVPAFFLIAFYGDGNKRRISLMFFFWTHVGAVILLLGFLTIGLSIGSFDFVDIDESEIPEDILLLSASAIIIGLGVKLAAFMFHIWLPYAHGSAPTPISALLSPAMIGIGAYGLFRLIIEFLPGAYHELAIWLHIWGLLTMIYGGIMALMQDDIKRLFAYSSISQMGYLLFGIGSYSVLGMTGAEMMYITHALGKGLLFMSAGVLIVQVKTRSISKLGGLANKLPVTVVCAVIGALTIMGVPPTSGFMGEWMLFYGAIDTAIDEDSTLRIIIFSLGLISTVITMSYMLWMLKRVFFGKLPENLTHVKDGNWYMLSPMIVLAGLTIILGIYPDIFLNKIVPYMSEITTRILSIN